MIRDTTCFRKIMFTTYIHRIIQMGITLPPDFVIGASENVNPNIKSELQWKVCMEYASLAIHFALAKQGLNHFHYYCGHKHWRTRNLGGLKQPCLNE